MFIDFKIIAEIIKIHLISSREIFNFAVILSQIISNVPATIYLINFTNQYDLIAYGVNLGANGLIIASFANIIALRFLKKPPYLMFHKYSIIFFIASYLLAFFSIIS
jgi:Na+/H+ antiporter NhaD/arsenite permease-like protein